MSSSRALEPEACQELTDLPETDHDFRKSKKKTKNDALRSRFRTLVVSDACQELTDLLEANSSETKDEDLRGRFRALVLSDDVDEIRAVWARFPGAAWACGWPGMKDELENKDMLEMLAEFRETGRLEVCVGKGADVDLTSRARPLIYQAYGLQDVSEEDQIFLERDELDHSDTVLSAMLRRLSELPSHADTSSATGKLRDIVLFALGSALHPNVAEALTSALTAKHRWDADAGGGLGQFRDVVATRELEADVARVAAALHMLL